MAMKCFAVPHAHKLSAARASVVSTAPCRPRLVLRANSASAEAETTNAMLQTVHRWFDSLHMPDHPLEDLVHRDAHLIDNTNQACYAGYKAMKHRMQVCSCTSHQHT